MTSADGVRSARPTDGRPRYSQFVAALFEYGARTKNAMMYSSAYLTLIAMIEVVTVMVALDLSPSPAPLVIGLVTFGVYGGDRIADVDADAATKPDQAAFVRRHKTVLSVCSAVAYGLAVAIALTGGPVALAITLLPGAFWILYVTDWVPSVGAPFKRLKDVLIINSAVVAGAWAVTLLFLPLSFAGASVTPTAVVLFVYFFLDTFVNTEIPNVEDMEGDAAEGVSTMPVVFGVRRTRWALYGLDLFLIVFLALAYLQGLLSVAVAVAVLVGLGYALVLAALVGRTDKHGRLSVAGEGKHLLVFGVIAVLSAGWP